MESARFELHFKNVCRKTNKIYVVVSKANGGGKPNGEAVKTTGEEADRTSGEAVSTTGEEADGTSDEDDGGTTSKASETPLSVLTVSHLVKVINQTLENPGHKGIVFNYVRAQSRIQVTVAVGKTLRLKSTA